MTNVITKIKAYFAQLISLIEGDIKRELPVGVTEFHAWADRIIAKGEKFADIDSMKFVLAQAIMGLSHEVSKIEDSYFVARLRKAAANQVAGHVFQQIKDNQVKAQQDAAAQAQQAATPVVTTAEATPDVKTQETIVS